MRYGSKKEQDWILQEKYKGTETPEYFEDRNRLQKGEPVDYIIGNRPFLNCTIDLSFHPLIPREETEYWVKNALEEIKKVGPSRENSTCLILDIFSGSGCIGLAALKNLSDVHVDFADESLPSMKQIKLNLKKNFLTPVHAKVLHSDVFQNIPKKQYDYIFANPPYIPKENFSKLDSSVRDFEPRKALLATGKGLFFIEKLLKESPSYLKSGGTLFIEFDSPQKRTLEKKLRKQNIFTYTFLKDQYKRWRTLTLIKI